MLMHKAMVMGIPAATIAAEQVFHAISTHCRRFLDPKSHLHLALSNDPRIG